MQAGADTNVKNKYGKTAKEWTKNEQIRALFTDSRFVIPQAPASPMERRMSISQPLITPTRRLSVVIAASVSPVKAQQQQQQQVLTPQRKQSIARQRKPSIIMESTPMLSPEAKEALKKSIQQTQDQVDQRLTSKLMADSPKPKGGMNFTFNPNAASQLSEQHKALLDMKAKMEKMPTSITVTAPNPVPTIAATTVATSVEAPKSARQKYTRIAPKATVAPVPEKEQQPIVVVEKPTIVEKPIVQPVQPAPVNDFQVKLVEQLKTSLNEATQTVKQRDDRIASLEKHLEMLQKQIDSLQKQNTSLESKLLATGGVIAKMEKSNQELTTKLSKAESTTSSNQVDYPFSVPVSNYQWKDFKSYKLTELDSEGDAAQFVIDQLVNHDKEQLLADYGIDKIELLHNESLMQAFTGEYQAIKNRNLSSANYQRDEWRFDKKKPKPQIHASSIMSEAEWKTKVSFATAIDKLKESHADQDAVSMYLLWSFVPADKLPLLYKHGALAFRKQGTDARFGVGFYQYSDSARNVPLNESVVLCLSYVIAGKTYPVSFPTDYEGESKCNLANYAINSAYDSYAVRIGANRRDVAAKLEDTVVVSEDFVVKSETQILPQYLIHLKRVDE